MFKRKKALAALLAGATCIAMLAGCGGSASSGGSASGGSTSGGSTSGGGAQTTTVGTDTYSMIDNFDVTTLDYVSPLTEITPATSSKACLRRIGTVI